MKGSSEGTLLGGARDNCDSHTDYWITSQHVVSLVDCMQFD